MLNQQDSAEQTLAVSSDDGTLSSEAYIVIDNDADKENICVGDYVTWTVEVQNFGPDTAKNTRIHDMLPDGLKYVSHSTTKGSFDPQTGIWDIGDLTVDDQNVKLFITTVAVSICEKVNEVFITTDTVNLNKDTFEAEEIDVFPQKSNEKAP